MLLVLASKWDEQAAQLTQSCDNVRLFTPDDLSVDGWRFCSSNPDQGVAVTAGECIPTREITGVFTRLPCVMPHELLRIVPNDRDYAAAEMHAFLVAWLSTLRCPVVNRPTPGCLAGPAWGRERWIGEAARHGIPVVELHRNTGCEVQVPPLDSAITVIGQTVLGANEPQWGEYAVRLARVAKVTALTAHFEKRGLLSACTSIDLGNEAITLALLDYFGMRYSKRDDFVVGVT
jgi:hypothetical protein